MQGVMSIITNKTKGLIQGSAYHHPQQPVLMSTGSWVLKMISSHQNWSAHLTSLDFNSESKKSDPKSNFFAWIYIIFHLLRHNIYEIPVLELAFF